MVIESENDIMESFRFTSAAIVSVYSSFKALSLLPESHFYGNSQNVKPSMGNNTATNMIHKAMSWLH